MSVYIENPSHTKFDFHYKVLIERTVKTVMEEKHIPGELDVNVLIVNPEEIRTINRENRDIDQVTDVLSFPYFEFTVPGRFDPEEQEWADEDILGDIVLCGEKVLSQAQEYGHSAKRELSFLVAHSMLHLIGYDHMEASDAEVMEKEQELIMKKMGLPR